MDRSLKLELIVGIFMLLGLFAFARLALEVIGFTLSSYAQDS